MAAVKNHLRRCIHQPNTSVLGEGEGKDRTTNARVRQDAIHKPNTSVLGEGRENDRATHAQVRQDAIHKPNT